ncbi:MAG: PcfJ domain-containing protein [Massilia sp.]|nr:PcfJ domain-containing protein [Massilia sp.]
MDVNGFARTVADKKTRFYWRKRGFSAIIGRCWTCSWCGVPPERRPQTAAQFGVLAALGSALAAPLGFHDGDDKPALLARYAPCMRHWLADVTRPGLAAATAAPDFTQLALDLADAKDFLRALCVAVQVMDHLDQAAGEDRVLIWCAGIPVLRLLALSHEWHAAIAAETFDATDDAPGLHWPAVLAHPWHYEQMTVIELTSSAQLPTEGQAMQHCVGSYEDFCRSGNSVIVSLRASSGEPASTAELHLGDGVLRVVAGQHRASRNALPSAQCAQALVALVAYLNSVENREPLRQRQDFQRHHRVQRRMLRGLGRAG